MEELSIYSIRRVVGMEEWLLRVIDESQEWRNCLFRVIDESQEWRNGDLEYYTCRRNGGTVYLEYQTSRRNGGMVTQSNKRVVGMEERTIPTIRLPVTECSNGYFKVFKGYFAPRVELKANYNGVHS